MKIRIALTALLLLVMASMPLLAQDGEQLFKGNCGACHTVGKGKLVGPDLKKVDERHDKAWLLKWVKSSQSLVKSGDAAATKLFADNNNIVMPDQTLSDEEIGAVLAYIKTKGDEKPVAAVAPAPTTGTPAATVKENSGSMLAAFSFGEYLMLFLLLLLILIIWGMAKAIRTLTNQLKAHSDATSKA